MTHTVPNWLERLLGVPAASGEGTVWSIEHHWPWPSWATLLVLAAAIVFVVAIYLREGRRASRRYRLTLAGIRLALVGLLMLMIAQVTLVLKRTGLPYAAVLVDDSMSMSIVDHYAPKARKAMTERSKAAGVDRAGLSRWSLLQTLLTEDKGSLLRSMADGHKLRPCYLTGLRPIGGEKLQSSRGSDRRLTTGPTLRLADIVNDLRATEPKGEATRLGGGIRSVLDDLRGAALSAIVVFTDGINTDGLSLGEAAEFARRRGVPLYFVGLGSQEPDRDLRLSDLMVDDVVFVNDVVTFECRLTADGFEGRKVPVVLREKGKKDVLAKVEVTVGPDGRPQQVRLPYRPTRTGQFEYVVEVEPQDGELQTENNRRTRSVEVRKDKIRVLLVQADPSFEFRYLRNMLRRDETISLNTILQNADPESTSQDATALQAFPLTREELFAYDVVILGDANPALLGAPSLQNLADFVAQPAKGGSLVLIAGPSYMPAAYLDTPLARLLPFSLGNEVSGLRSAVKYPNSGAVLTEGFVVQPTDLGLASPSMQLGDTPAESERIWRSLAPLYWLVELPELKPGVRVLAEHPTRTTPDGRHLPVFCLQYVGAGKVLFHATDETWRWRFQSGDAYVARYWVQTIRWLSRSKLGEAGRSATLVADRREYTLGESVRLRVRFADERLAPAEDDGVRVVVEQAGRRTERIKLHRVASGRGVFEGQLERPGLGAYHVWLAAPQPEGRAAAVDFSVVPPPGEFARTRMDAAEMRRAAQQTGGQFYTFETVGRLTRDLPPGQQVPVESLPPRPLWNRWPVLAAFLGLLIVEWLLRKRGGMV
ncbi:MAG: VWA domain-containing protein [Thermoguttaceae bacterium]